MTDFTQQAERDALFVQGHCEHAGGGFCWPCTLALRDALDSLSASHAREREEAAAERDALREHVERLDGLLRRTMSGLSYAAEFDGLRVEECTAMLEFLTRSVDAALAEQEPSDG